MDIPEISNQIDKRVGEKLRQYRISRGYSQSDLGEECGISFQQVQKYERGHNRISASRLYLFAKFLQVSVKDFFDDIEISHGNLVNNENLVDIRISKKDREFLYAFKRMKESEIKRQVLKLVKSL